MGDANDLRQFIRDIANRHERIWREQAAALGEQATMMREQASLMREMVTELRTLREENRADHRAQLDALMHVLDRLQNGGAQA